MAPAPKRARGGGKNKGKNAQPTGNDGAPQPQPPPQPGTGTQRESAEPESTSAIGTNATTDNSWVPAPLRDLDLMQSITLNDAVGMQPSQRPTPEEVATQARIALLEAQVAEFRASARESEDARIAAERRAADLQRE